ncbi:MAG: carbohydrate ABC transporter substrate-binding protein, partial [Ruminococcus sp.]|nr:carbohydrate ABC transporter substrate-binding protein [Ruminococcus sp.]
MKKSVFKRASALTLAALMAGSALAGCQSGGDASSASSDNSSSSSQVEAPKGNAANGKVYYLNFKPEQDAAWQALAKKFTEEKGIPVTVKTAAEGTYEETLTAEMDKSEAP